MARQSRQSPPPPFLLTRPAAQGARFAAQLRARFGAVRIVTSPLLAPLFLAPDLPLDGVGALIFTSETGVAGFLRLSARRDLPAWCVGDRTAAAARAAGLPARAGGGDAAALCAAILAAPGAGALLHLRGAAVAGGLAEGLRAGGADLRSAVVYDQRPQPLTRPALALLAGANPVIAPLFSPRTAALLAAARAALADPAPLWQAALSPAVAAACVALPRDRLAVAPRPEVAAMLRAIDELLTP